MGKASMTSVRTGMCKQGWLSWLSSGRFSPLEYSVKDLKEISPLPYDLLCTELKHVQIRRKHGTGTS